MKMALLFVVVCFVGCQKTTTAADDFMISFGAKLHKRDLIVMNATVDSEISGVNEWADECCYSKTSIIKWLRGTKVKVPEDTK